LRTRRQWLFAFAGLGTAAALVIVSRQTMTETEDLQLADFTEEEILDAEGLDLLAQTDADFEDSLEFLEALEDLEVLEEGDV
jgi:hypothetical protein